MLSARLRVTLIGNPSGTETTMSVTATMKLWSMCDTIFIVLSCSAEKNVFALSATKMMVATAYPSLLMSEARRPSCICNGVSSSLSICAPWFTLPYSVASPTFSTCITPCPSTTVVPRITRLEAYVASLSKSASTVVLLIIGSPVSDDSLTCSDTDSSRMPSAGISSPVLSRTISPTTTSLRGICLTIPSLTTVTSTSSLTVLSTSNALFAFASKMNPMVLASIIAKNMPSGSRKAAMPSWAGPQQCTPDITIDSTHAKRRILMIGSSNFSKKSFHSGVFAGGVSIFVPYLRLLSSISVEDRPLRLDSFSM